MQTSNPFKASLNAVATAIKGLPRKIGAQAVLFSKQRFREQAWADNATQPWAKRKRGAKRDSGRAILKDSGRLQRSIRIISVTPNSVTIGTDVPYAQAHNEGFRGTQNVPAHTRSRYAKVKVGTGSFSVKTRKERTRTTKQAVDGGDYPVKAFTRKMNLPKRQFIGNSQVLNNQIKRLITAEINRAMKA
jgi:phage gpG-like protein